MKNKNTLIVYNCLRCNQVINVRIPAFERGNDGPPHNRIPDSGGNTSPKSCFTCGQPVDPNDIEQQIRKELLEDFRAKAVEEIQNANRLLYLKKLATNLTRGVAGKEVHFRARLIT